MNPQHREIPEIRRHTRLLGARLTGAIPAVAGAFVLAAALAFAHGRAATAAAGPGAGDPFAAKFAASRDSLTAWRIYTGKDGTSHLEKVRFKATVAPFFGPGKGVFQVGNVEERKDSKVYLPATPARVLLYSAPGNVDLPEHVSPGSEMFLVLRGTSHLILRDGTNHEFGPGDMIIFEDTTGPGHASHIDADGFTAINFSFDPAKPVGALVTRP